METLRDAETTLALPVVVVVDSAVAFPVTVAAETNLTTMNFVSLLENSVVVVEEEDLRPNDPQSLCLIDWKENKSAAGGGCNELVVVVVIQVHSLIQ